MSTQNLLVELFVEELPPKALRQLGHAFAQVLGAQLVAQGLCEAQSVVTPFATPRRLAAHVSGVRAKAADRPLRQKLMPVSVGLDAQGQPTPALLKKLQSLGVNAAQAAGAVAGLQRAPDGKAEALFYDSVAPGVDLAGGLQKALDEALAKLPIPKVMQYQLHADCELPGWSSVNFVRPAHGLVALYGEQVVPVSALGLRSGRQTRGHRFEASREVLDVAHADQYAETLLTQGAVMVGFEERRAEIERQLAAAALAVGGGVRPIADEALLDEVTALVERPHVLTCQFEPEFLEVPQECLILTMKANQKYFPLLDAQGKLTHRFLVVSNIRPADASAVVGGNERVVRPRLADAKFFFDQDRKKSLADRVDGLAKVVYHNKLGTQGERTERVRAIARALAAQWPQTTPAFAEQVDVAARLAKTDLLTDMVGEFPELQGIMGGYYARHDGLGDAVAQAIEDHYKPRFAGDELPRNPVGLVVALADKLETLVGMFGIGQLPTGDKDPFALRRHALGVIRMLRESQLPLGLSRLWQAAVPVFGGLISDPTEALSEFVFDRLAGALREGGYNPQEIAAVLGLRPDSLADVAQRLEAVRAFAALPEAAALAAANKRIGNILKKAVDARQAVEARVNPALLQEAAEQALYARMQSVLPQADQLFEKGDYTASLQALSALRSEVDAFFDGVMVNAEQLELRLNRQGLLKQLHGAMNRVADLAQLAVA
ncbi:MAG: glycyl-tRNA ligase subunit beta [Pseudomonadota bacterium]